MLRNPKYTGYNVWGRHDKRPGRPRIRPREQWVWSPTPTHPVIVSMLAAIPDVRDTWQAPVDEAFEQTIEALDLTATYDKPKTHPRTRRHPPARVARTP